MLSSRRLGLVSLFALLPLAPGACADAQGGTVIVVTLTGVDPTTRSLRATSYLNDVREQDPVVEPGDVTSFGIRLPAGSTGDYRLDIDALGNDLCSFAVGRGELQIASDSVVDLSIPVRPLDVRTCALSVSTGGPGQGWVESNPAGIRCGSEYNTCFAQFQQGAQVSLVANPEIRASFDGWSVGCSGTGTCLLGMDTPISVVAAFGAMPVQNQATPPAPENR